MVIRCYVGARVTVDTVILNWTCLTSPGWGEQMVIGKVCDVTRLDLSVVR